LFEAVSINNKEYIDGGITNNLPLAPIDGDCSTLIGVYVNHSGFRDHVKGLGNVAERAFHLAVSTDIERKKSLFDIYIEPRELANYGFFDLKKGPELYRIGYETALEMLKGKKRPTGIV